MHQLRSVVVAFVSVAGFNLGVFHFMLGLAFHNPARRQAFNFATNFRPQDWDIDFFLFDGEHDDDG